MSLLAAMSLSSVLTTIPKKKSAPPGLLLDLRDLRLAVFLERFTSISNEQEESVCCVRPDPDVDWPFFPDPFFLIVKQT